MAVQTGNLVPVQTTTPQVRQPLVQTNPRPSLLQTPQSNPNTINWNAINFPKATNSPAAVTTKYNTYGGVDSHTVRYPNTSTTSGTSSTKGAVSNTTPPLSFGGLVGSLANTAQQGSPTLQNVTGLLQNRAQQGSPTLQNITGNLQSTAQQGSPVLQNLTSQLGNVGQANVDIGREAANISKDFAERIAQTGQMGAGMQAGQRSTGTAPVGEGNAAITAQTTAAQQQALAQAQQAALQGTAQQLTGQSQYANALTNAGNLAQQALGLQQSGLTSAGGLAQQGEQLAQQGLYNAGNLAQQGQQLQQSGLTSAAQFSQPQLGQYGQAYYSPLTAQSSSGTAQIQPNDPFYSILQQYAQMAVRGEYNAIPDNIKSNPVLNLQMQQMAREIDSNYNPVLAQASVQTQQTGQQVSAAAPAAYQALDSLQEAYDNMPQLAKGSVLGLGSIPLVGQKARELSMNLGPYREQVSLYEGALNEARAQISAVLAPLIGVEAGSITSGRLLPENMTPGEVPKKIKEAREYIKQRVESYTQSGIKAGQVPSSPVAMSSEPIQTRYGSINPNI